jgi:hypothetical protein
MLKSSVDKSDMENSQFFKQVWRINGVIIMVAGLLAIGVLMFATYQIFKETVRERGVSGIVNIEASAEVKEKWQLGYLSSIQGTPFVMIPLSSDQQYSQSYYDKSASSIRNYLFINKHENQQHWLLSDNEHLIMKADVLSESTSSGQEAGLAILFTVITSDTNNDDRLTAKDLKTVAISQPGGQAYREVLQGIDRVVGYSLTGKESLMVVYQRGDIGYTVTINLADFSVSTETALPKIQN